MRGDGDDAPDDHRVAAPRRRPRRAPTRVPKVPRAEFLRRDDQRGDRYGRRRVAVAGGIRTRDVRVGAARARERGEDAARVGIRDVRRGGGSEGGRERRGGFVAELGRGGVARRHARAFDVVESDHARGRGLEVRRRVQLGRRAHDETRRVRGRVRERGGDGVAEVSLAEHVGGDAVQQSVVAKERAHVWMRDGGGWGVSEGGAGPGVGRAASSRALNFFISGL